MSWIKEDREDSGGNKITGYTDSNNRRVFLDEDQFVNNYPEFYQQYQSQQAQEMADRMAALPSGGPAIKTQVQPQTPEEALNSQGDRRYENSQLTYDKDGKPVAPLFESGRDKDGNLLSQYQINAGADVTADRSALDAMKTTALSNGPSPWASMMLEKQKQEQSQAADNAALANASQLNAAKSQMAQTGGLGAGSRERLSKSSMVNGLLSQQNVNRQGSLDRANIGVQDEQQKLGLLNNVQGQENNQAQLGMQNRQYATGVDQANTQMAMTDMNAKRAFDANSYNQAMQAWGAAKSADAQAALAGKKPNNGIMDYTIMGSKNPIGQALGGGCFLTTAAVGVMGLEDDCWVLNLARSFRDGYMTETPERALEIQDYYQSAPQVVETLNKSGEASRIWKGLFWKSIIPFVLLVRDQKLEEAHEAYKKLINEAKKLAGV